MDRRIGFLAALLVGLLEPVAQAGNPTASGVSAAVAGETLIVTGTANNDDITIAMVRVAPGTYFAGLPATQCIPGGATEPVDVDEIQMIPESEIFLLQVTDNTIPEDVFDIAGVTAPYLPLPDGTTVDMGTSCDYENRQNAENLRAALENLPSTENLELIIVDVLEGHDIVDAGALIGDDAVDTRMQGGPGDDYLISGDGDDLIDGGEGNDTIFCGGGDDGDPDPDVDEPVTGGPGYDTIYGGGGDDYIDGGADNDFVSGGGGVDVLNGGDGSDVIDGGADDDEINGGSGDDVIRGGRGSDDLSGGGGYSVLDYGTDGGPGGVTVNLVTNTATDGYGDSDDLADNSFAVIRGKGLADTLIGDPVRATHILGMGDNDTIRGGLEADLFFGEGGNDSIEGCDSTNPDLNCNKDDKGDVIFGGAGDDTIIGASGADTLFGDGDVLDHDQFLVWTGDPDLSPLIEIVPLSMLVKRSAVDLEITQLIPPTDPAYVSGNDTISGGPGGDVIVGGGGGDTLYGCPAAEDFVGVPLPDNVPIYNVQDYPDGIDHIFGDLHVPVREAPVIPDQGGGDTIFGGPGGDFIMGGGGSDTIYGNAGFDVLCGDFDYDMKDNQTGLFFFSWFLNDGVFDLNQNHAGAGADTIHGGDGDDEIYGGPGGDTLMGEKDDDIIQGNLGSDSIYGGNDGIGGYQDLSTFNWGDTVDYSTAQVSGIVVDLGTFGHALNGFATDDGDGGSDFVIGGIEHAIGTNWADVIFGTGDYVVPDPLELKVGWVTVPVTRDPERFFSGAFDSIIVARGGDDVVMGRGGEDLLVGGTGNDTICGDEDQRCDPTLAIEDRLQGQYDEIRGDWGADTLYGDGGDDVVRGGPDADTLAGGVGIDTLDYSDAAVGAVVNLRMYPMDLQQLQADLVDAAHLAMLPLKPDDDLTPLANGTDVQGGSSASDGGDPVGVPTAVPPVPPSPSAVDTIVNTPPDNPATDTVDESQDRFEVIVGSGGNDLLIGHDSEPVALIGWSGNDILIGGDSVDVEKRLTDGSLYDDVIWGDGPDNPESPYLPEDLRGWTPVPGNDLIEGGLGDDKLVGGGQPVGGIGDFVSYTQVPGPVTVSLADTQPQETQGAGQDTLLEFENLIGSDYAGADGGDRLIGNDGDNWIYGGDGDDALFGGRGDDTLVGGTQVEKDSGDYQSCPTCIDPDLFSYSPGANPGEWTVSNDGQGGQDILLEIEEILEPPDPVVPGPGGGGTVPAPQELIVDFLVTEIETIAPGGEVEIQYSVTGGVPPYTRTWDPLTDLDTSVTPPWEITILTYDPDYDDPDDEFDEGDVLTATASPIRTTSYRLTVTDYNGTVKEAWIEVKVADELEVDAGDDRTTAAGEAISLAPRVAGGVQPYGYQWAVVTGGDGGFQSATDVAAPIVAPTESTVYELTVTDSIGSSGSDTVTVSIGAGAVGNPFGVPEGSEPAGAPAPSGAGQGSGAGPGDGAGRDATPRASGAESESPASRLLFLPTCAPGVGSGFVLLNMLLLGALRCRRRWF